MENRELLSETRKQVDDYIRDLLEQRMSQASRVGDSYVRLWQHIATVVGAGGKRIRPYLVMVGNGAFDARAVPIAAAQELVHIAMLVHDDVIDRDFMRHGEKNINGIYREAYGKYLVDSEAVHFANSAAILAGDALLSEAYMLVSSADYDAAIRQQLVQRLNQSIYEVIGGEFTDAESGFVTDEECDPLTIYRYKTASYSFVGPLVSGAYCASSPQSTIALLESYGANTGVAFQIQDDLLGVFGDSEKTGKSTTTDIREGKCTLLAAYHRRHMNDEQRQRFETIYGNPEATVEQIEALKHDMMASGAKQKTTEHAQGFFDDAAKELARLPDGTTKTELTYLSNRLQQRDA